PATKGPCPSCTSTPFCSRAAVGERTKSDVDVQNRDNGRSDGLHHGSHGVSDIYPDRDLSCCGKRSGVCREGGQPEDPQPPRGRGIGAELPCSRAVDKSLSRRLG